MNAWVPRKAKLNDKIRITAGGASKLLLFCDAAPTVEMTLDGGTTWLDVSSWFTNPGTGFYSFVTNPAAAAPRLLGSMIRVTAGPSADFYCCQEE